MKKFFALIAAALLLNVSIAIVPTIDDAKPLKATEIMIPVGKTGQKISLADFSRLTPSEYEKLASVKLRFFDKIAYKKAMKKLRRGIAADGTITDKKIANMVKPEGFTEDFHLGGFALGFLLGILGVLIAYLINGDNKSVRIKWAWLGLAAIAVIIILGWIL